MPRPTFPAFLPLVILAGCDSPAEQQADAREDRIERQAETSANAAGSTPAALGMSETQLLEADLVAADGTDLGDVEQVRRNASGTVDGFLVEVENSDPDRYVLVPLEGLSARTDGADRDLQTNMTAADLAAMPDAMGARQ